MRDPPGTFLKTLKHGETPSGSDIRIFYVFRCLHFPVLAVQLLKNKRFFYWLRLRQIHRETPSGSALWNPVAAKMAPQYRLSGANMSTFLGSLRAFYGGLKPDRFLDAFWLPFGSLLLPL